MTLAGWAAVTKRVTLGLLVGANTFRNAGYERCNSESYQGAGMILRRQGVSASD